MANQTAQDLAAAADLIEEHGLSYGKYYDKNRGSYCLVGALREVAGHVPSRSEKAIDVVKELLALHTTSAVARWSDHHYQPEVVEILRKAAHSTLT